MDAKVQGRKAVVVETTRPVVAKREAPTNDQPTKARDDVPRSKLDEVLEAPTALLHGAATDGATTRAKGLATTFRPLPELIAALGASHDDPVEFESITAQLDGLKAARLVALGERPSIAAVESLLDAADAMHGKGHHAANAVAVASAFTNDAAFVEAVGDVDGTRITQAIRWLNLGDLESPVSVIAARRKLTDDEFVAWVKPRPGRAADLFVRLRLGDDSTADLIRNHRGRERSTSAVLVDIFDQMAALGAKPFFQKDGVPDTEKVFGAIRENAEKARVDTSIIDAIQDGMTRGLLASAIAHSRKHDLYVR